MFYDPEALFGEAAQDFCLEAAEDVVAEIENSAASGTKYVNKTPVDLGNLVRSYEARRSGGHGAEVTTDSDYSDEIEFGTRYMRAQPHRGPAVEAVKTERKRR